MKECILIVNHDTGEYRLEKLNSNIAVKKTRRVACCALYPASATQTHTVGPPSQSVFYCICMCRLATQG